MPYHDEMRRLLEEVALWADLRHEQGCPADKAVEKIIKRLEKTSKKLRGMESPSSTLKREPDDYAAILALRPNGPRRLTPGLPKHGLASRMKGAWLGRLAGCTLGASVEGWSPDMMERLARKSGMDFPPKDYWIANPNEDDLRYGKNIIKDYLAPHMTHAPVDDDTTYTLIGLLILETYGPDFNTDHVGEAWLKWLPMACTAEHVALENLRKGIPAAEAAIRDNPYVEWIGADIRSDPWGYAAPGWPERAAAMAWRDAYLSHRRNGVYGAMMFSAAIAAAFAVDDPLEAIRIGLTEIPKECRLYTDVTWALDIAPSLKDYREARAAVDQRFPGMSTAHTNNNACLTVFGLSLGMMDFERTIGATVAMGLDNDCTAATACSLLGAVIGDAAIPENWWKPFHNKTRSYMNGHEWFQNTDVVKRFLAVARRIAAG